MQLKTDDLCLNCVQKRKMRCAQVSYFVMTMFVAVYSLPRLCVFGGGGGGGVLTLCYSPDVNNTLDFIPAFSQHISSIDLRDQPFEQLPYNAFGNLSSQGSISRIVLRNCKISHVDAGALLNLHNLTTIDLSHNKINQIDSKLFSNTKQIKYIYMSYNKIEVLPSGLFQNLTLLEEVDLDNNQIRQVERSSFENTPSLRILDLRNNHIEFINMLFKDKFDNLTYLRLAGNPWKCNCELGPLYEFLVKISQLDQYGLECEEPPIFYRKRVKMWKDMRRDKFVCRPEEEISAEDSVDTGTPQPPSNQTWIECTRLVLEVVCVVAVITGVVFVVRHTRATTNVPLSTIVNRGSDRRSNGRNMDSGLPMRVVQSSAVSENDDSVSNMADVDEKLTLIHHH